MKYNRSAGFVLSELMIVLAIIAIVAAFTLPILHFARIESNETYAVATLREIISAQTNAQNGPAYLVDVDQDGIGEFCYFGELSGKTKLRTATGVQGKPLEVGLLDETFQQVEFHAVQRSGYFFQIWLPDDRGIGLKEAVFGGADPNNLPDTDGAEQFWCAYAWPVHYGSSGNRVFFVNQFGSIIVASNGKTQYSGYLDGPRADAAFRPTVGTGVITGPYDVDIPAKDDQIWTVVR